MWFRRKKSTSPATPGFDLEAEVKALRNAVALIRALVATHASEVGTVKTMVTVAVEEAKSHHALTTAAVTSVANRLEDIHGVAEFSRNEVIALNRYVVPQFGKLKDQFGVIHANAEKILVHAQDADARIMTKKMVGEQA